METSKPTIKLTDNKSFTRFCETNAIPPSLWNACDYVLQFNFKIAFIADSVNRAADFLSRLKLKVTGQIRLKLREDVQTTPIEEITSSSVVAEDEHLFYMQKDGEDETEAQAFIGKEQSRKKSNQNG